MFDVKIINGTVFDGTGRAGQLTNIAFKDGLIAEIGPCVGAAEKVIDAADQIITPGFIDIHTHYDGQVSWDDKFEPSVYHGVTTLVMGSCGVGFAPMRPGEQDKLISLMEGVEEIPGTALAEGIPWTWESFPEYMDAIDTPHTIDFAVQVVHDPLRMYVMGERALYDQVASDADIDQMARLTREALKAGAVGFSTGRSDVHRTAKGEWTPSSEANAKELTGIASALKGLDHGVLQAVNDFDLERDDPDAFDREFDLLEDFVAASGGKPLSLSLMQRDFAPKQWQQILTRAEKAEQNGLNFKMQVAPRGIGVTLGLDCTFHPFMGFPSYKKISHLPLDERVAIMREADFKAQLLSEKTEPLAGDGTPIPPLADKLLQIVDFVSCKMFMLGDTPDYEQGPEKSVYKMAEADGVPPLEKIYDILLEKDGHELIYFPLYNYTDLNYDAVKTMMDHPQTIMGLSDGGAHVGTVCDASFPTYLISHWTRDRTRGAQIPLAEAVQKLSSEIADFIGFTDRGRLAVGLRADVNVIDYQKLTLERPKMVADLPAGGKRLIQKARGYLHSFVAGQEVIRQDELTNKRPGKLVRLGNA